MRDDEAYGAGDPGALEALFGARTEAGALIGLAEAYRRSGWRAARLDPLGLALPEAPEELEPGRYGLEPADAAPLRAAYCGTIGWEIGHVQDRARREWLAARAEEPWRPAPAEQAGALDMIARGEHLEATFGRRMPGTKTFGLAGAEGYLVLTDAVIRAGVALGARHVFAGGMHRGRFTQMGLNFGKPLTRLVAEAQGTPEMPFETGAASDVPYHLGFEGQARIGGHDVTMWVSPHPSHLSVVGPVMQGRARAIAEREGAGAVLSVIYHTDAAIAGQGINMEVFQLSGLAPFHIGGTIHLILNNQIGFTTEMREARTARSCADIAKLVEAPVLHVNGDDPEALLRVGQVAAEYRARFGADIVVDMVCYRRKGHNEIDEPHFTQPMAYKAIDAMPKLSEQYGSRIGQKPDVGGFASELDRAFGAAKQWAPNGPPPAPGLATDIEARLCDPVETGVDIETLRRLGRHVTAAPEGMALHPKVARFLDARAAAIETGGGIDWATAEALALASLADQGTPVRFGGQDSIRGAFTQRHLALFDQQTGVRHIVLDGLAARVDLYNAPLIEHAILAFEYGRSTLAPGALAVWEAQFGDFLNVCQPVFDQVVACAEDRWLFESALTILLPHGLDGGGPDHATARPERLLMACAKGNMRLVNASTPANFFHALRRQMVGPLSKPLVVLSPKALLRHPGCVSRLDEMGPGSGFRTVIGDDVENASRAVLCTGKLYHFLEAERRQRGIEDVAMIRLEQLYPLDEAAIAAALKPCRKAELVWAQEEPENFGYFGWLDRRLEDIAGRRWRLVSRPASPSASAGPKVWDDRHLKAVIDAALDLR
ncbi:MAG TPA: 2-oxoglutarate dehydrogenase E1 component [Thermohalobaculum sp.]|nr:2-oxoglutarate dehydrogenase E1 component [Thermohalobaculum sp.]